MIYSTERELNNIPCESKRDDVENKFVNEVCESVIEILNVGYNERRIVFPLLVGLLTPKINEHYPKDKKGLLQQYEEYILDKSSERIIRDFDLGDVKINHENALHAKFNDIIEAIKVKIKKDNEHIK